MTLALVFCAVETVMADPCDVNTIEATVEISPRTLNLKSRGNWVTCRVWLEEGYSAEDIDPETIVLEDTIEPDWKWVKDNELKLKFLRSQIQDIVEPGDAVELVLSGELTDGTPFEGIGTIRVIGPTVPPVAITKLRIVEARTRGREAREMAR